MINKLINPRVIGNMREVSGIVKFGIHNVPPIVNSVKLINASMSCLGNM